MVVDHGIQTMTITVDVVHRGIIITMMMNITTLVHADPEGLTHPITMTIICGDTSPNPLS